MLADPDEVVGVSMWTKPRSVNEKADLEMIGWKITSFG